MSVVLNMIIHHINISIKEYGNSVIIFLIFIAMVVYISEKVGFEKFLLEIKEKFIKDNSYKWKVLFFTYFYFILDKTLISRDIGSINSFEYALKVVGYF